MVHHFFVKNVIIIHGIQYSPSGHWQQWLRDELNKRGIPNELPTLPNYDNPLEKEWVKAMNMLPIDESTIMVAHSLGCAATLRFLEQGRRAGIVILVSGFLNNLTQMKGLDDMIKKPFDWKEIRKNAREFIVINSDNDPFAPEKEGTLLAEGLQVPLILEQGLGHINIASGHGPYSRVLDFVLKYFKK